jgi:uncharacterized protein YdeI (YjbR/CyaY-like superfamily)
MTGDPIFFANRDALRAWLAENHATAPELHLGLLKAGVAPGSLTIAEAVEEALCFGWIDGQGRRIDDRSYRIRFTPRRPGSIWSAVNLKRVEDLTAQGLMQPAGLAAHAARKPEQTNRYSHENEPQQLDAAQTDRFQQHPAAWEFFQAQAPSYQRAAIWWVVSAKQEATRELRLERLIEDSANGQRLAQFSKWSKKAAPAQEPDPGAG